MSILDREALEQSPLADLHAIASELSIDSFRRMRKAELIEAILARQSSEEPAAEPEPESGEDEPSSEEQLGARRRRWRRGGRGRGDGGEEPDGAEAHGEGPAGIEAALERAEGAGGDSSGDSPPEEPDRPGTEADGAQQEAAKATPDVVEGVVELLPGGSGFVRVHPPDPSDEDVYISSAQVKRCELITGDRVSGPRRAPRRSERFASLVRVDTVNDRPASELADSVRFDDRPVRFPDHRFDLGSGDPLLQAIDGAVAIGRGSRVTICGPAASGKSHALRQLAGLLSAVEGLQVWLALTGVRPEELAEWQQGQVTPAVGLSFAASADAQSQALEGVVEQVRRLVARGADAVILIDSLDGVTPSVARKALVSARNVLDGGSLTVIATSSAPLGGETTVIALQPRSGGVSNATIDQVHSWTIRRELLG